MRDENPAIAFVLWSGNLGGAELLSAEVAIEMRRSGVEARVLFVKGPTGLDRRLLETGVPYASFGLTRSRSAVAHPRQFAAWIKQHAPAGVFLPSAGHLAVALRLGGYRAPVIGIEHGMILMLKAKSLPARWLQKTELMLGSAVIDAEIAVSDHVAREIARQRHLCRVVRIHNGVPLSKTAPSDGRVADVPVVVGAARLVPGKGIDHLIRAFAAAERQRPARLVIAGEGSDRPRLERIADDLGLGEKVQFLGWVDDMRAVWDNADVAVTPSAEGTEAFGMTALEAMSRGVPVIASRTGGLPEIVEHGVTGLLVEPGDSKALTDALTLYISNPDMRAAHGSAGRSRAAEHFSIEAVAGAYASLMHQVKSVRRRKLGLGAGVG